MSYLVGEDMVAGYGGANILNSCTIQVDLGQIGVVVGPNGAGKSTAMKALFGMLPLQSGSVKLLNETINDLPPFQRVKKGMAFVPQTENIFTSLTVEENLEMGAFTRPREMVTVIEQVYSLFPVLKE
jgi:branched-chain amino acid transport system ATP-binding protein